MGEALCPSFEEHTPCPSGYIDWHEWAARMKRTHRQIKCGGCGRYSIWEPLPPATPEEIARKLSVLQRDYLLSPNSYADPNTIRALRRKGLLDGLKQTELARAVLPILQRQES
jgi:hypothetical protein